MSRTYTDTPEPRYVERAKYADNGGGGSAEPISYTTVSGVISVEKGFRVGYSIDGEDAEIEMPLEGTDDVIVDIDNTNQMINIHLDATVRNKLAKALVLPSSAPSEDSFVMVGTNNAQKTVTKSQAGFKPTVVMTETAYEALTTTDPNTVYMLY